MVKHLSPQKISQCPLLSVGEGEKMKNKRYKKIANFYLVLSYLLFGIAIVGVMVTLFFGCVDIEHSDLSLVLSWMIPTIIVSALSLWGSISLQRFLHRKGYLRKRDMLFDR